MSTLTGCLVKNIFESVGVPGSVIQAPNLSYLTHMYVSQGNPPCICSLDSSSGRAFIDVSTSLLYVVDWIIWTNCLVTKGRRHSN